MKFALMITSSIQQSQRYCLFEKTLVFTLPHYSHIGYFFCFLVDCILAPWWLVVTTAKLHSTNSSSAQIRILLATCQNFAIMRPSDDGPSQKQGLTSFVGQTFCKNTSSSLSLSYHKKKYLRSTVNSKGCFNISVDGEAKIITEWDRVGSINRNYHNISFLFPLKVKGFCKFSRGIEMEC